MAPNPVGSKRVLAEYFSDVVGDEEVGERFSVLHPEKACSQSVLKPHRWFVIVGTTDREIGRSDAENSLRLCNPLDQRHGFR